MPSTAWARATRAACMCEPSTATAVIRLSSASLDLSLDLCIPYAAGLNWQRCLLNCSTVMVGTCGVLLALGCCQQAAVGQPQGQAAW